MAAPAFAWKAYEVSSARAARPGLELAGAEELLTVEIPDLSAFPTPADKARILLESAAEVEHALLVQYLYALFSLKSSDDVSDSEQQNALSAWAGDLLFIARQEMAHLMTAQNLLLALGLPPNLEREDFPPQKDLYPFAMHLEPLSQRSLAKYVAAESPDGAPGIDDILALAIESAGTPINRVGTLYGMLGLVFSTKDGIAAGGSGSQGWDDHLRELAAAAHQQAPAERWHLPEGAINPATLDFQAHPGSWPGGGVNIHEITDRATALAAIKEVAEEGEGSTGDDENSHFGLFRNIFRGTMQTLPFPPPGEWAAARAVPTDPRPAEIAEPRTARWVQLGDHRNALLLGFIEHHLLTADETDRGNLANWALSEMTTLKLLAGKLATLPQGGGVAGLPFTLPVQLHLPAADADRWQLQRERTQAAMDWVRQMLNDPDDADDAFLAALRDDDASRLAQMHGAAAPPVPTTSFARDILPLFRPIDIEHMIDQMGMDISDYDVVRASATKISRRMKGIGGRIMPPPPDPPLSAAQIELFDKWVADGFPK